MSLTNLYNSLKNESSSSNDVITKEKFIKNVNDLDERGQEMFYVIIKIHQMENKKEGLDQLPYESKFVSSKLRLDFEKLPNTLKHILSKFMEMHIKSIEEEKQRPVY